MSYQWRDLIGSLVGGKYRLSDYLGDLGDSGDFAAESPDGPAIVRVASGEDEDRLKAWSEISKLQHPNLVRSYEAGREQIDGVSFVYTAMEKPDDSLAEVVEARALNEEEARDVVNSMLSALAFLHEHGFVHGAVEPKSIVAVGNRIKLSSSSIRPAGQEGTDRDMFAAGQTIVEILTQHRPVTVPQANGARLPAPFDRIANACMRRGCAAKDALDILRGRTESVLTAAAPPAPAHRLPKGALVAMLAGVLLLVVGLRAYQKRGISEATIAQPAAEDSVRQRTVVPPVTQPVAPVPQQPERQPGAWAVVAAIYNDHELALRRSSQIEERWKSWDVDVFPPAGGAKRYMVVLGYAETRREAERLAAKARAAGLPSDTYVTKIAR